MSKLERRVQELERRVRELEARPVVWPVYQPVYVPYVPYAPPEPHPWNPPYRWDTTPAPLISEISWFSGGTAGDRLATPQQ